MRPAALLGLLAGCATPPVALLGTGELAWEPLAEGDDLTVIRGPQGGYHVLGSVRTAGLVPGDAEALDDASNPTVTFQLTVDGEALAPFAVYAQGLDPLDPPRDGLTHEMIGRLVILDVADDDEVVGLDATLSVEVADAVGVAALDERVVRLRAHPLNDAPP